ncbi:hypothetical protein, conserved [Eimeria maxima]|uniref:Uncharacterized protein n=1 Tax=Eimeria maxima TaxID=5804 RepID=U6MAI2_EIMMA|nr:hypothetical protein, conserved [Eimeria maxima]CDJ59509.1 hypothetical protein, conserved [Eimeria maxima]
MSLPYSIPSALMTAEDEDSHFDSFGQQKQPQQQHQQQQQQQRQPQQQQQQQQQQRERRGRTDTAAFLTMEEVNSAHFQFAEASTAEGNSDASNWAFTDEDVAQAAECLAADREKDSQQQEEQRFLRKKSSKEAAATLKATSAAHFLVKVQAFMSRIFSFKSKSLPSVNKQVDEEGAIKPEKQHDVVMAFHQRGQASELLQYHFTILLLAVAVSLGTQNALAPNLSRIAETFHFTDAERDIRVGGELA